MKVALKYCIAFFFFLSIILYTHVSLASIKQFDEILIQNTNAKTEEVKKEAKPIIIIDNLFLA